MAGVENIWNNCKPSTGIRDNNASGNKFKIYEKQSFGDGKVEFLCFTNKYTFGVFERGFGGFGTRVAQGEGPF